MYGPCLLSHPTIRELDTNMKEVLPIFSDLINLYGANHESFFVIVSLQSYSNYFQ